MASIPTSDPAAEFDVQTAEDVVMVVMTQHWDMAACWCWVCLAGRRLGLHPTSDFLHTTLRPVKVEQEPRTEKVEA